MLILIVYVYRFFTEKNDTYISKRRVPFRREILNTWAV